MGICKLLQLSWHQKKPHTLNSKFSHVLFKANYGCVAELQCQRPPPHSAAPWTAPVTQSCSPAEKLAHFSVLLLKYRAQHTRLIAFTCIRMCLNLAKLSPFQQHDDQSGRRPSHYLPFLAGVRHYQCAY